MTEQEMKEARDYFGATMDLANWPVDKIAPATYAKIEELSKRPPNFETDRAAIQETETEPGVIMAAHAVLTQARLLFNTVEQQPEAATEEKPKAAMSARYKVALTAGAKAVRLS